MGKGLWGDERRNARRSDRRWSAAFFAIALVLATWGAFASLAQESREWVNSDGDAFCRGTLDVERTLAEAPDDGAPKIVYFRTDDGEKTTYRYRWLSVADRERVLDALDAASKADEDADEDAEDDEIKFEDDDETSPQEPETDVDAASQTSVSDENSDVAWDAAPKAGTRKVLTVDGVEYAFRYCPAGTFTMGSPESEEGRADDETQREVTLTRGFWLLETEVTVEMWRAFAEATDYEPRPGVLGMGGVSYNATTGKPELRRDFVWENPGYEQTESHPVTSVEQTAAVAFCEWLSQKAGVSLRLPTDAEWEYACRAGTDSTYSFGSNPEDATSYANVADASAARKFSNWATDAGDDGYVFASPVKSFKPNAWGLYDMHGNVWEWCADFKQEYDGTSQVNPKGTNEKLGIVWRGGAWNTQAPACRSASRGASVASFRYAYCGFRIALDGNVDATSQESDETTYDVALESFADGKKIPVIKVVRAATGRTLGDSKTLVESAPATVATGLARAEAEALRALLEEAGAVATLRPSVAKADENAEGDEIEFEEDDETSPQEPETDVDAASQTSVSDENSDVAWDAAPKAGTRKVLTVDGVEYAFRYCPAGTFTMGSPEDEAERDDDETLREVTLTRGFWTLETEVTQEMYEATTGANPSGFSASGYGAGKVAGLDTSRFPVERVSWADAQDFIAKLNAGGYAPEGFAFRLPTEAEWEYACRAGTTTPYFWGSTLNGDKANCAGNYPYGTSTTGEYLKRTTAVGSYDANAWGLYDMHGNVWEWCADWRGDYDAGPQTDPTGPKSGWGRVLRGGSWDNSAEYCRSAIRFAYDPTGRSLNFGFRLVLGRDVDAASPVADEDAEDDEIALGEDNATSPQEPETDVDVASQTSVSDENSDVAWDAAPKAGTRKVLTVDGVEYAFRYCPAGTFTMGSPESERAGLVWVDNEAPQHEVTLTRGFWTLETEITQEMYDATTGANPSFFSASGVVAEIVAGLDTSRFPVEEVSWNDAQEFIAKLNAGGFAPDGFEFRLPTEAEWEYACRAGTTTPFSWGSSLNGDKANCNGNSLYGTSMEGAFLGRTTAVGSYEANPWGLYDMHGNVCEWCADWRGDYDAGPQTDPTGPKSGSFRVLRGGSWAGIAKNCRSAHRDAAVPSGRSYRFGFRLVLGRDVDAASPVADEDAEGDEIEFEEDDETSPQEPETDVDAASQTSVSDENSDVAWDAAPKAGTRKVLTVDGVEYAFRYCPAGTFTMGSPESEKDRNSDETQHMVELTNGFWMLETEVTQAMWKAVMGANPSEFTSSERNPVENVRWIDSQEFIKKLNSLGVAPRGFQFRLPSEAEWEYACRAGAAGPYAGASLDALGWYTDNSGWRTHEVGTKSANAWGLYDMHGNVGEWCEDRYDDYKNIKSFQNPINVTTGSSRVLRGGSWADYAESCRSAFRNCGGPTNRRDYYGFRLVLGRDVDAASPIADEDAEDDEIEFEEDDETSPQEPETDVDDAPQSSVSDENSDVAWDAAPKAGTRKVLTVDGVEYAFRYCPSGTFQMGSPESEEYRDSDETQHMVELTNGFWMLETEVTQEMYEALTGANPSNFSASGDGADDVDGLDTSRFPVEWVSWNDAQEFIAKLNAGGFAPEGFAFRLPTEAEWEYACRAGTTTPYFWGSRLNGDEANCNGRYPYGTSTEGEYLDRTTAVGSYDANAWGLYDMHGNVWEWCADWYGAYASGSQTDPTGPKSGSYRVLRGGCWYDYAKDCRSASRFNDGPTRRLISYGFRLVLGREL